MYSLRRQYSLTAANFLRNIKITPSPVGWDTQSAKWTAMIRRTTAGVNDEVWNIDLAGHPHSEPCALPERYKRVDSVTWT